MQPTVTLFIFEIRQFPILPSGVPLSTFGVNELNFCVRNGNRWILVAIITGMAPLVGLEATPAFQNYLFFSYFCLKTGQKQPFLVQYKFYATAMRQTPKINFISENFTNRHIHTFIIYKEFRSKMHFP